MSITTYINNKGFYSFEGYSQQIQQQVEDLISLTNKPNLNVMEIGFNAGNSAEIFLQNNKELTLNFLKFESYLNNNIDDDDSEVDD